MHPNPLPAPLTLHRRSVLALLCLGWVPTVGRTAVRELRVITAPDSTSQRPILQALTARYPSLVTEAAPSATEARRTQGTIVALGPIALRHALASELKGPVIATLTSSQTYRRLTAAAPPDAPPVTAIYADASPLAQLQLIAALFERRVTVGVLLSDASAYLEKPLRQAAALTGLDLLFEKLEPSGNIVRALNRLSGAQVLLAVPDNSLYTPETLRSVLESTYRQGLPVIGFSAATVAAGTLATAYSDTDDVVTDLAELLDTLGTPSSGALAEPRFPRYWRVSVNSSVARSLGMAITEKVLNLGNRASGRPA